MSAEPADRGYGKVSKTVMVITVVVMVLVVAAIALLPFYEAAMRGPETPEFAVPYERDPGVHWTLPEAEPAPSVPPQ